MILFRRVQTLTFRVRIIKQCRFNWILIDYKIMNVLCICISLPLQLMMSYNDLFVYVINARMWHWHELSAGVTGMAVWTPLVLMDGRFVRGWHAVGGPCFREPPPRVSCALKKSGSPSEDMCAFLFQRPQRSRWDRPARKSRNSRWGSVYKSAVFLIEMLSESRPGRAAPHASEKGEI